MMQDGALFGWALLVLAGVLCCVLILIALNARFRKSRIRISGPIISRATENPILSPLKENAWEDSAVFNPTAVLVQGNVHLFYRALGGDGISRIGYAVSKDGIHFERFSKPAFVMRVPAPQETPFKNPFADSLHYDTSLYASGGGWGGSEDPRAVSIEDTLYMTFGVFESWESLRLALTSLSTEKLEKQEWDWAEHFFISPKSATNKNWVLFPEKIQGKFAILHALTPQVLIAYANSPEEWRAQPITSDNRRTGRAGHWDAFVRGAAAAPLRTTYGWLLLYHGMNPEHGPGYKVGAMILDINDPTKILYRSKTPILEPKEWYENDWKPGVVYASGAVIKDGTLFVYYGGGDKTVNVATAPLDAFLKQLIS